MQAKNKNNFRSFASPGGLNFSSKSKRKKVVGVRLQFELKLPFSSVNSTVMFSVWIKSFKENIIMKSPRLSASSCRGIFKVIEYIYH